MYVCACHGTCMEVRGQLVRVISLPTLWIPGIEFVLLNSQHLYWLSHLAGQGIQV